MNRCGHHSVPSILATLLAGLVAACGADHGPSMEQMGPDPDRFYEPPPQKSVHVLSSVPASPGAPSVNWDYRWTGTKRIGGKDFDVLLGTEQTATPNTIEVVARVDGDAVEIASFTVDDFGLGTEGIPDFVITGPEPVRIPLDIGVGQSRTVTAQGELVIAGEATPGSVTATYTLVDDDATVQTASGPVSGCRHFTARSDTTPPVEGEVWIKTGVGVVAAKYDFFLISPGGPKTWNLESMTAAEEDGGRVRERADQVLVPGGPWMVLRTGAAEGGKADADKNVHAKFLVEARWADEDRARTDDPPPVLVTVYAGPFGYFPEGSAPWQRLPVSILNPTENGKGFSFWFKWVDQAAKNDPMQPIGYSIEARWDPSAAVQEGGVRVSMVMNYPKYEP